jgi:hypothetical protein
MLYQLNCKDVYYVITENLMYSSSYQIAHQKDWGFFGAPVLTFFFTPDLLTNLAVIFYESRRTHLIYTMGWNTMCRKIATKITNYIGHLRYLLEKSGNYRPPLLKE